MSINDVIRTNSKTYIDRCMLESNGVGDYQWQCQRCQSFKNVFTIYCGSMFIKSWSHIL